MPPAPRLSQPAPEPGSELERMTAYVQGVFYLDRSVFVDTPLPEFLAELRTNPEKLRFGWAYNGCEVGSFPAHAIRTARQGRSRGGRLHSAGPPAHRVR